MEHVAVQRKNRLLLLLSFVVALTILSLGWFAWTAYQNHIYLNEGDPTIDRIDRLQADIRFYDGMLTMSARMAAATGDLEWERDYREYETALTAAIDEVMHLTQDQAIIDAVDKTSDANDILVDMEHRAFEMVRQGRLSEANILLTNRKYSANKARYAEGMSEVDGLLDAKAEAELHRQHGAMNWSLVAVVVLSPSLVVCWVFMLRSANGWHAEIENHSRSLAMTNEELQIAKEMADEANKAKTWFLSRLSHELRTPLNAILGYTAFLEESELGETQRRDIDQINKCGQHLLELINDILDISRYELGARVVSLETVDVMDVLQESVGLMQSTARKNDVALTLRTGEPTYVIADRRRLRQVALNLLSNAIKYNVRGGSVDVAVKREAELVVVTVADTGIGIPGEKLQRLFTPFDRIEAQHKGIEGTGLGLVLARSLVEAMGGRLEVTSEEKVGSRFSFTLTSSSYAHDRGGLVRSDDDGDGYNRPRKRILVVEDNPLNVQLMRNLFLDRTDIELCAATRGQEALQRAKEDKPDVVLLDLNLPDMSGVDVMSAMKADADMASVPIIIVTANDNSAQAMSLLKSGAYAHISKPIIIAKLLEAVDSALGGTKNAA